MTSQEQRFCSKKIEKREKSKRATKVSSSLHIPKSKSFHRHIQYYSPSYKPCHLQLLLRSLTRAHVQPATRKEQYSDAPLVVTPCRYSSATATVRSSYGRHIKLYVRKHPMATRKKKSQMPTRRPNKKGRRNFITPIYVATA